MTGTFDDDTPLEPLEGIEVEGEEVVETIAPHQPQRYSAPIEYDELRLDEVRVGVIVPFDFGLDWEYWRYLPEGVALYFTRTPHVSTTVGIQLARAVGNPKMVHRAAKTLRALNPASVLYACSSGSFVGGLDGEAAIRQAIIDAGIRRAVTTSSSMAEALEGVNAKRLAVASPYTKKLNQKLVDYLEDDGFRVVSTHYLGIAENMQAVSQRTIGDLVRSAHHPNADAIFVSCTALRTYGLVADMEQEIDTPVFTSNQVSLWAVLKHARAELLDPNRPGWVLGGGQPMARSTEMLIELAQAETDHRSDTA